MQGTITFWPLFFFGWQNLEQICKDAEITISFVSSKKQGDKHRCVNCLVRDKIHAT